MTVTTFRAPIYFLTVLVLTSGMFSIYPSHATSDTIRSSRHSSRPSNAFKDFFKNALHKGIKIHTEVFDRKLRERKSTYENERLILSTVGLGYNAIVRTMTAVANVLNARSNIDAVDRFMDTFIKLFSSRGGGSLDTYYFLIANFWVIYDATSMIFRAWENRFAERRSNVQVQGAQDQENEVIEETLAALQEANEQLSSLKENLVNLIRRQDIAINTVAGKRIPAKMHSSHPTDESNEKGDEDLEKEYSIEPFTLEEAVSVNYADSDISHVSIGQRSNGNDIPD